MHAAPLPVFKVRAEPDKDPPVLLGIDGCGRIWREDHRLIRELDKIRRDPEGPFKAAEPEERPALAESPFQNDDRHGRPGCGYYLSGARLLWIGLELARRVGLWRWFCAADVGPLLDSLEPMTIGSQRQLLDAFAQIGLLRPGIIDWQRYSWDEKKRVPGYNFSLGLLFGVSGGEVSVFDETAGQPTPKPPRDESYLGQQRRGADQFASKNVKGRNWVAPVVGYGLKRRPGVDPLKLES